MKNQQLKDLAKKLCGRAANRLDVDGVAADVVRRLGESRSQPVRRLPPRLLRAAAIAALVVGVGVFSGRLAWRSGGEGVAALPELDELSGVELEELLDSMVVARPTSEVLAVGLDDLDEVQLSELLRLMEG